MKRYHVNPATGEVSPCRAQESCPFGDMVEDHYRSASEARRIFEERQGEQLPATLGRSGLPQVSVTTRVVGLNRGTYFGAEVEETALRDHRLAWVATVGEEAASAMNAERGKRTSGPGYHVTALTPKEVRKVVATRGSIPPFDRPVEVTLTGVGRVANHETEAWFITCEAPQVDEWRAKMGLPPKDFHITLGFTVKDIYDQFKGPATRVL